MVFVFGAGMILIDFCCVGRPKSGSMLLYSRKKVRYRRDGYCWKKRKDGKTTREDHMKLKVQGTEVNKDRHLDSLVTRFEYCTKEIRMSSANERHRYRTRDNKQNRKSQFSLIQYIQELFFSSSFFRKTHFH